MDKIASALSPIKAMLWGERAIANLGAPIVCEHYMLVIEDENFESAVRKLRKAGFQDCAWSYGSREPDFYRAKSIESIYRRIAIGYSNLDRASTRFLFPTAEQNDTAKIVLLPSSYAHISPLNMTLPSDDNILLPDAPTLLMSFIQTVIREPFESMWTSNLCMWAISYVYGELGVSDEALDSCDDEEAKIWFNERIQRFGDGIDRVTCTKRLGKGSNY